MTKTCEWCGVKFDTLHKEVRFCSFRCSGMARRKRNQEKRETRAKELGITVEELIQRSKHGKRMGLSSKAGGHYKYTKRPKTYKEIKAYNEEHPLVEGWRR